MNGGRIMVLLMRRLVPGTFAAAMLATMVSLTGCGPQPTYQVVQSPPPARTSTVESMREVVEQKDPSGAGLIVGGLVGGGLGSLCWQRHGPDSGGVAQGSSAPRHIISVRAKGPSSRRKGVHHV